MNPYSKLFRQGPNAHGFKGVPLQDPEQDDLNHALAELLKRPEQASGGLAEEPRPAREA
ncbi:hypothetical protein ABZ820_38430 [Streptomyces diacarni]|uniref:hypothetical protein n=1 Tax=Streptomyces diacarni TaxID=2800381 RepID=UPI0033C19582